ncbi:hypothetical protein EUBC25_07900 [Claveliimonas bilis]|nr:hypothetical protein EUBC25_07900 [Claveliimonas bilis]
MDSCDNQGQRAYSDGNDLNYISSVCIYALL